MAFENWPYSDFHDLNLDWILRKVKEALRISGDASTTAEQALNYSKEYFASAEFTAQVDEILRQMSQDGTLAAVINETLFGELNARVETLEAKNILLANGAVAYGQPVFMDDEQDGTDTQGMAFDGVYFYQAFSVSGTNNTRIVKYLNGAVQTENTVEAYHANDIEFYNGKLYAACGNHYNGTPNGLVAVIDAYTLALDRVINAQIPSVAGISGITFYNGVCYVLTYSNAGYDIYTLNVANGAVSLVCHLDFSGATIIQGCLQMDDKYFYVLNSEPGNIQTFTRTGVFVNSFDVSSKLKMCYATSECEGFAIYNNVLYLSMRNEPCFCVARIGVNQELALIGKDVNGTNVTTFTVDGNPTTAESIGNGAFKTINHALQYINSCAPGTYYINVSSNDDSHIYYIMSPAYDINIYMQSGYAFRGWIRQISGKIAIVGDVDTTGDYSGQSGNAVFLIAGQSGVVSNPPEFVWQGNVTGNNTALRLVDVQTPATLTLSVTFGNGTSNLTSRFKDCRVLLKSFRQYSAINSDLYTSSFANRPGSGEAGNGAWLTARATKPYATGGVKWTWAELGIDGIALGSYLSVQIGGLCGGAMFVSRDLQPTFCCWRTKLVIGYFLVDTTGISVHLFEPSGNTLVECAAGSQTLYAIYIQ